jgi:hypothetical protein
MKQCPRCNRNYADDALSYCLEDGAILVKKYDPDATLVNPYPPVPVVPPTVAYQGAPVTSANQAPGPAPDIPAPAAPRKSPWLVGVLVVVALGVGLAIGGFFFQRSSTTSTSSSSIVPERDPVATGTTTPPTVPATPTPTAMVTASPNSIPAQSTPVQQSNCMLYNDRSDLTVVNVREGCDQRNCELDASTKAGEYPDHTPIRVIMGSNVRSANFTWVKVVIVGTERIVWVAASKIKCT